MANTCCGAVSGGRMFLCGTCAPVFCECPMSDADVLGQCRRCWRADLRSPRLAESAERLDHAIVPAAPTCRDKRRKPRP